jgi:hypothetical protein
MNVIIKRMKQDMLLPVIFGTLFFVSLFMSPIQETLEGFLAILLSKSILVTDYLVVGGLSATLLNVSLTVLLNLWIIKRLKLEMNGPIFAGLLTIAGFAFFGKNMWNSIPIYLGIYLYSRVKKVELKSLIVVLLFSSGISPIVSYMTFGLGIPVYYGLPLGIVTGLLVGFILPIFNSHAIKFHQGYNLYNTGFSMGVLSMVITGIIEVFTPVQRSLIYDNSHHQGFLISTIVVSLLIIAFAFMADPKVYKKYTLITRESGRLLTDFIEVAGKPATLLNIGLMGLFSALIVIVLGIQINGPVFGAILTIVGFGAFGKHLINSTPVVVGAILAVLLTPLEFTLGPILAILFVTGLAPISGRFGPIAGLIAGFMHLLITPLALQFQGGFDLYNNGFAAGFIGAIISSLFVIIKPKLGEKQF